MNSDAHPTVRKLWSKIKKNNSKGTKNDSRMDLLMSESEAIEILLSGLMWVNHLCGQRMLNILFDKCVLLACLLKYLLTRGKCLD